MPNLTRAIEKHIHELLQSMQADRVELRRKELAELFGCVPSQINYVLRSRFTPEHGFLVESQRGEHGYIRVVRISCKTSDDLISHVEELIGNAINEQEYRNLLQIFQERNLITSRERLLIEVALRHASEMGQSDFDVPQHKRNVIQAEMLKRMMRSLILA